MSSKLFNIIFSLLFITFVGGLQGNVFFIFWSIFIIFLIFKFLKKIDIFLFTKIFIFIYWLLVIIFYQLSDYNWNVQDVDSDGHMNYIVNFDFAFIREALLRNIKTFRFWDVRMIVSVIWYLVSKVISFVSFESLIDQESQRFLIFQINILFQILSGFVFTDILKFFKIFIEKTTFYFFAVFVSFCNPGFLYYQGYVGKESLLSFLLLLSLYLLIKVYSRLKTTYFKSFLKFISRNFFIIITTILCILIGTLARPYFPLLVLSSLVSSLYFLNIKIDKFLNFIIIFSILLLSFVGFNIASFNFIYFWFGNSVGILLTPNIFKITNYFDFPFQTITALFTSLSLFIFAFKKTLRLEFFQLYYLISPLLIAGGAFALVPALENVILGEEITNLAFFLTRTRLCIYQLLIFLIIFKTMRVGFIANKQLFSISNEK